MSGERKTWFGPAEDEVTRQETAPSAVPGWLPWAIAGVAVALVLFVAVSARC